MPVCAERIQRDMERFASFGASGETAVSRLALTPEDREARAHFVELCRAEGMEVRIDRFGNMAGLLGAWDRPALLIGSHLDTVPSGGRFDGTVGVVAALEVIRALREDGALPPVPVGVVNLTAEESARWGVATMGSKGLAGIMPEEKLMALTDRSGIRFDEAVRANAGYELVGGAADLGPVAGWLELHVEQGLELELARLPVGVVSRVAAPSRFKVLIKGEAAHSGATIMGRRKDGLVIAAELVLGLEELAEMEEGLTVATATLFSIQPVSINVVPGFVELGVDIRSVDSASKRRTVERFFGLIRRAEALRGVRIEVTTLSEEEPVQLSADMAGLLERGAQSISVPCMPMFSRAGHDTMYMAKLAPSAMLFVPSRDGISHNPAEFTELADIVQGTRVLAEAVRLFRLEEVAPR